VLGALTVLLPGLLRATGTDRRPARVEPALSRALRARLDGPQVDRARASLAVHPSDDGADELALSRFASVALLIVYLAFLHAASPPEPATAAFPRVLAARLAGVLAGDSASSPLRQVLPARLARGAL
jgi:hypothetical protein